MEKQSTVGYCSIHNMGVIHAIEGSMWEYADESLGDIYAIFMDDDGNGHDFALGKKEWNQIEEMDEQTQWDVIAFYSDISKPKSFLRCSREFAKDMLALLKEMYKIESSKRKED